MQMTSPDLCPCRTQKATSLQGRAGHSFFIFGSSGNIRPTASECNVQSSFQRGVLTRIIALICDGDASSVPTLFVYCVYSRTWKSGGRTSASSERVTIFRFLERFFLLIWLDLSSRLRLCHLSQTSRQEGYRLRGRKCRSMEAGNVLGFGSECPRLRTVFVRMVFARFCTVIRCEQMSSGSKH